MTGLHTALPTPWGPDCSEAGPLKGGDATLCSLIKILCYIAGELFPADRQRPGQQSEEAPGRI